MRTATTTTFLALLAATTTAQDAATDAKTLATACNRFAADLHAAMAPNGAPTASPGSIAIALCMLLPGARGETAAELQKALHLPVEFTGDRLHVAAARMLDDLGIRTPRPDAESTVLKVTNDLWTARSFEVVPAYAELLRTSFAASHHSVDFAGDPQAARAAINAHVKTHTNGRIPELVPVDLIGRDTRVVLTNAIWLKAAWLHAFAERGTKPAPFHFADGSSADVPTMQIANEFAFAENDAWQCVVLPFDDHALVCEVILPRAGHTLTEAEAVLLQGTHLATLAEARVHVKLPRFRTMGSCRLREALLALGIRSAFGGADFSGIATNEPLVVGDVVHQTWIQVDEKGAEAAGATAVVLKRGGEAAKPVHTFTADRPFAFTLRDRRTGLVLFLGRVDDPRATAATVPPMKAKPPKSAPSRG